MDNITGNYFSTIEYSDSSTKTNTLNLAVMNGFGSDNILLGLTASTAGMDSDDIPVFGRGEIITFTIAVANFNSTSVDGFSTPIQGWGGVVALPIVLTLPKELTLKDYTNDGIPVGEGYKYVQYTENGTTKNMVRVRSTSDYQSDMYAFRMIEGAPNNTCTFLIPKLEAYSSAYITFIAEAKGTITLGQSFVSSASLDYKIGADKTTLQSNEVTVKHSYIDVFAEKKAPASVYYDEEFSYEIIIKNNGNLTAEVNKISDLLPTEFTISKDADTNYVVSVKRDTRALVLNTDYTLTVYDLTGLLEIVPVSAGKLDIAGSSEITVTITGKVSKTT